MAGVLLAALLSVVQSQAGAGDADNAFAARLEVLEETVARVDLAMVLMRQQGRPWQAWRKIDAAVEKQARASHPGADPMIAWRDPELKGDYLGWLLDELLYNAELLHALGHREWGLAMLAAAEALADTFLPQEDLPAMLLANTMARLLMAGWRDTDDPISTLALQVNSAAANVGNIRAALHLSPEAMEDIPGRLPGRAVALAVRRLISLFSPVWLEETRIGRRKRIEADGQGHAVEPDEIALAVNLPLSLTPVGNALEGFLETRGHTIPAGRAVCLGSGDGAEPLRIAAIDSVTSVLAVDHSRLAVERMLRMRQRLRALPDVPKIQPLQLDVAKLDLEAETVALVVANHLFEYLEDDERLALYKRIGGWLKPGGLFFANVHVAEGSRYQRLLQTTGNVQAQPGTACVRVTIKDLVPARPEALQVQHFFLRGGLEAEIAASLMPLPGQFELAELVLEAKTGFVEAVCVVRKISQ